MSKLTAEQIAEIERKYNEAVKNDLSAKDEAAEAKQAEKGTPKGGWRDRYSKTTK